MNLELDGTRALVHAASTGLGRAVAATLAAEGAAVVVASSDVDRAAATAADVGAATGVVADLTDEASIRTGTARAVERLGGLDVLVTNHPGTDHGSFTDFDVAALDQAYEATLRSMWVAVEAALPALRDGGGSIVNVVAASAREPPANHVLSNTLRLALFGLSKSLANELAPDVRVNCACPRGVETDRVDAMVEARAEKEETTPDEVRADRTDAVPAGRFGDPAEFGDAVAYLASDRASFVTGETLAVDGGWLRGA
jgi:NAD(P)-dependent dehydrogenase (short-subunit alcohol dehydrogenase family)